MHRSASNLALTRSRRYGISSSRRTSISARRVYVAESKHADLLGSSGPAMRQITPYSQQAITWSTSHKPDDRVDSGYWQVCATDRNHQDSRRGGR